MSMQVGGSSAASMASASPASSASSNRVSLPGGTEVSCPGINGSLLDQVTMMTNSFRQMIESADAGIRACQVK